MKKILRFKDGKNWFRSRQAWVKKDYLIPSGVGNGVCLDIGANVGAFPGVHHKKFKRIICIEPSQESYKQCVANTKKYKNVEVYRYGVSDKTDKILHLKEFVNPGSSGNASTLESEKWYPHPEYEEVPSISLEDIFEKFELEKIDYLKIDCEGAEYDFLLNKDLSKIDFISAELHIQIGEEKIKELEKYIEKDFDVVRRGGVYMQTHIKATYKNKRLGK